jgi:hypothetical protein
MFFMVLYLKVNGQQNIRAFYDFNTTDLKGNYYQLKNGHKVGIDSVYILDYDTPCESEGKIIFRDKKTDKIGFFNADGKIVIPAVYNDARPYFNGLAVVVYNAKRKCPDGKDINPNSPCEHWYWNGISAIINEQNQIIIDSINIEQIENLNRYSLIISSKLQDTSLYVNFKAKDGQIYSFVNYKREFKKWLYDNFIRNSTSQKLQQNSFSVINVEGINKNNPAKCFQKLHFLRNTIQSSLQ